MSEEESVEELKRISRDNVREKDGWLWIGFGVNLPDEE